MAALLHTSLRLAGAARLGGGGGGGGLGDGGGGGGYGGGGGSGGGGGGGALQAGGGGSPRDPVASRPESAPAGLIVPGGMAGGRAVAFWARGEPSPEPEPEPEP